LQRFSDENQAIMRIRLRVSTLEFMGKVIETFDLPANEVGTLGMRHGEFFPFF
jgi:hypothetical protein